MIDIELTFINQSNDVNNSEIVIFQKNTVLPSVNIENGAMNEIAVAWHVIKNCGHGWSHKIKFPVNLFVGAEDPYGNTSDQKLAQPGTMWDVAASPSGDTLILDPGHASTPTGIEVKNNLPLGNISAMAYRDGKLLAVKTGIAPGQKAGFNFPPTIWVGAASQIDEGQVMNSAIIETLNTEISLMGIRKANLVMTGGGAGSHATPFVFTLVPTEM